MVLPYCQELTNFVPRPSLHKTHVQAFSPSSSVAAWYLPHSYPSLANILASTSSLALYSLHTPPSTSPRLAAKGTPHSTFPSSFLLASPSPIPSSYPTTPAAVYNTFSMSSKGFNTPDMCSTSFYFNNGCISRPIIVASSVIASALSYLARAKHT